MFPLQWTSAELMKLKELRESGMRFAKIAQVIGKSRNAVIGQYQRQMKMHGWKAIEVVTVAKPRKPRTGKRVNVRKSKPLPPEKPHGKPVQWPCEGCLNVIGEPRELQGCGQPRRFGSVYCEWHYRENVENKKQ